jgi:hypothetical protein
MQVYERRRQLAKRELERKWYKMSSGGERFGDVALNQSD